MFNVSAWTNYSIGSSVPPGPSIDIREPDQNDQYYPSNFPVLFDVDLSQSGRAWFSLDNGASNTTMNTDDNLSFTYSQSTLAIGNYTFKAYANFTGTSQTATASANFRVRDTTSGGGPSLSIVEPDPNDVYYSSDFPVTFLVDLSQNGKAWFSLNNGVANTTMINSSNSNTHFTYSQSTLAAGNYTFKVYANFTGTLQRVTSSVNFRVGNISIPPNTTIVLNNSNSSNPLGIGSQIQVKYFVYWLLIAVLSIAIIILIFLIIKYFQTRSTQRYLVPSSIVSQLR